MLNAGLYNNAIKALGLPYSNTCKYAQGKFIGCDEVAVTAKAQELYNMELVKDIEELFAYQMVALRKRSASTDGVRPRRLTNVGMDAMTSHYDGVGIAIAAGVISQELTDEQKAAMVITIEFERLMIKVCDRLSIMALNGQDYSVLFAKAKAIKLDPSDLTQTRLAELYNEFGLTEQLAE